MQFAVSLPVAPRESKASIILSHFMKFAWISLLHFFYNNICGVPAYPLACDFEKSYICESFQWPKVIIPRITMFWVFLWGDQFWVLFRPRRPFNLTQDGHYCLESLEIEDYIDSFQLTVLRSSFMNYPGFHVIYTFTVMLSLNWCKLSISPGQETQAKDSVVHSDFYSKGLQRLTRSERFSLAIAAALRL